MALSFKPADQTAGGFGFPTDGTAFKLRVFGAARQFPARDGEDSQPPYPCIGVAGVPVSTKTFKPIQGEKEIVQFYGAGRDFKRFFPHNEGEGNPDKFVGKIKLSTNEELNEYETLATPPGKSDGFPKEGEAARFMDALDAEGIDVGVDLLSELSNIVCSFVSVHIAGKKNPTTGQMGKDRDVSFPGRVYCGPDGKPVDGAKVETEEEEEKAEAPKSTGKAKTTGKKNTAKAEVTAESEAIRMVKEAREAKPKETMENVSKQAIRFASVDDAIAEADMLEAVRDFLKDLKFVSKHAD